VLFGPIWSLDRGFGKSDRWLTIKYGDFDVASPILAMTTSVMTSLAAFLLGTNSSVMSPGRDGRPSVE
jgi:hypothetical protein